MAINNVTVLGAGNLGAQIAFRAAYFGKNVTSYDINEEALAAAKGRFEMIAENYKRDVEATDEQVAAAFEHLTQSSDLLAAVADADLVIEAIPEVLELKRKTFTQIKDVLKPEAILVSNSSTLPPSVMVEFTGRPEKFMNFHFANDIHVMNIVEVMPHKGTSKETYDAVAGFAPEMGMRPILLKKEQPGYIINTLLVPWLEAGAELWVKGIADVATIDGTAAGITNSPRFAPFRTYDIVGAGVAYAVSSMNPDPVMQEFARRLKEDFIDKGKLGVETKEGFYVYGDDGEVLGLSEQAKHEYDTSMF